MFEELEAESGRGEKNVPRIQKMANKRAKPVYELARVEEGDQERSRLRGVEKLPAESILVLDRLSARM